jgi:hypothetical protein
MRANFSTVWASSRVLCSSNPLSSVNASQQAKKSRKVGRAHGDCQAVDSWGVLLKNDGETRMDGNFFLER